MEPSPEQLEARTEGTEKNAVRYMNRHHFLAILVFVLAIITGTLWYGVVVKFTSLLLRKSQDQFNLLNWILLAVIFSIIAYIIIRFVVKIPITSAFAL